MKVKNLLLAGLAAIAMTACNNENEFINDENPNLTGEQAKMRLLFSFDGNEGTRTVTPGGDDAGTELEYGASKITVVLDYGDNQPLVFVKDLTLTKPDENSKVAVATTAPFDVAAGANVQMYAFVNPKDLKLDVRLASELAGLSVGKHLDFTAKTGLAYIDGDVAKPAEKNVEKSGFLMSGQKLIKTITSGITNNVEIEVSRVAAKLDEGTKTDLFNITSSGLTFTDDITAIGVKFVGHSYSNLVNDSYVLPVTNNFKEDFLQKYIPVRVAETNDASYRWSTEQFTYCLENGNSSSEKQTRVHYKAKVYFTIGAKSEEATEDFYIRAVFTGNGDEKQLRVYKNWAALKAAYPILEEARKADDAYLGEYYIMRYVGGVCYYEAPIETFETDGSRAVIVRNNWYKLSVSEVSKLGTPTPAPEPEEVPTKLVVNARIQPWKVQINDIKL